MTEPTGAARPSVPPAYPPPMTPAPAIASADPQGATLSYLPRWGVQTGLIQVRQAAFWMFVVLLALTALTVISEQLLYLQYFSAGWMFSLVLLVLYVIPVLVAIYTLDLFEREPLSLIIGAFLWGGVIAIGLSVVANTSLLEALAKLMSPRFAQTWGVAIVAPVVEETFKVLGVITIYLIARSEIDDLFDGFVYGAIVGLGFAALENVQYFIQSIGQPGAGDQIGPVLQMFFIRAILVGAYMHTLWTGISGLGVAYYITQRDQPRQKRLLVAIGLFLLAIAAHFIWNSPLLTDLLADFGGILLFGLIKGLPFLIFLVLLVYLAQRREHRWFGTITASDVGTDVISQSELTELGGLRSRRAARQRAVARKGPTGGNLQAQLQREQINLAMIRSRAGTDDDPAVVAQRERIRGIRAQLAALPDMPMPVAPYMPPAALIPTQPMASTQPQPMAPTQAQSMAPTQAQSMAPTQAQSMALSQAQSMAPTQPLAPAQAASIAQASTTPPATPAAPVAPPPPQVAPAWTPTHVVPATGMVAWSAPNPTQPPVAQLAPGVQLVVIERQGAWARVVGFNGWMGWVDGRLLQRIG